MMPRVLILCAIPVEIAAVKAVICEPQERILGQTYAVYGHLRGEVSDIEVALVETGMGSVDAALNTESAVKQYGPELTLFVGIAGGVKDVTLGDVVLASKVHYYEKGKDVEGSLNVRSTSQAIPFQIEQIGKHLSRENDRNFNVYVAPIAAGEKVVGSSRSATADLLRRNYGDALAVEMEGAGFTEAMRRNDGVSFGLVRGVSDLLDSKDVTDRGGWQERAAANACTIALAVIDEYFRDRRVEAGTNDTDSTEFVEGDLLIDAVPAPGPNNSFILVAPPGSPQAKAILSSGLPLNLVLDLDHRTDIDGLYSACGIGIDSKRVVKLATTLDTPEQSRSSTTWLAVNGLDGRLEPLGDRDWVRTQRRLVRHALVKFAEVNGGRLATLLVAYDAAYARIIRALAEDCVTELGEAVRVICASNEPIESIDIGQDVNLPIEASVLQAALTAKLLDVNRSEECAIPGASGIPFIVDPPDLAWLREDLEVCSMGAGSGADGDVARLEFLRGGVIGWDALAGNVDVFRDLYPALRKTLSGVLRSRRTFRQNLFHEPGAGGTTLARRCIYDFHVVYPSVIVKEFRALQTARRLDWITRQTEQPVFCVVDQAEITDRDVADLLNELQAASTPAVVLHVSRRFKPPSELSTSPFLRAQLSAEEASDFFDRYVSEAPGAYVALTAARDSNDERRNAFYFGLSAFEDEFDGLEPYVLARLRGASESQRRVALFCALAHYFGQQGLPEHRLATIVGLPVGRADRLSVLMDPALRTLLHRSSDGIWRTVHQLVAKQIMIELGRPYWKDYLTTWGREFVDFCRGEGAPSEEMLDLVKAVLFDRGTQALLGTEVGGRALFSRLTEDIPSAEGSVALLAHASNLYPDEAHLTAHVARYYAFKLRNYERATEYADRATTLDPESSTLHHVLGMVYRARAYDAIGLRAPMQDVSEWGKRSSLAFRRSRQLATAGNEYAYVSDIQLRIAVIGYAVRDSGSIAGYVRGNPDPYVIECIDAAEDLLYALRGLGDPRNPSGYEQRSRGELTALYGDFDSALQMFDSLLSRSGTFRPPVRRQIVWTHLARVEQEWSRLSEKALSRVVRLLEENFQETAYSGADVRAWWRAIRYLKQPPSQDRVLEVLAYWREQESSVDSYYSTYVSYAVDVLDGIKTALPNVSRFVTECQARARGFGRRTSSFDWVGDGAGVSQLVHNSELGGWNKGEDFWHDSSRLRRVTGRVFEIRGPQAGNIDVNGMKVFFVPLRAGLERGRDDNARVSGYLGFSYDGPRLWEVRRVQK